MEWLEAAAVVRFDAIKGQELVSIEPSDHGLSSSVLKDLTALSMPDCLEPMHNQRCQYVFRVRDKHITTTKKFYSAFCSFMRVADRGDSRGYFTQAVILVCSDGQSTFAARISTSSCRASSWMCSWVFRWQNCQLTRQTSCCAQGERVGRD